MARILNKEELLKFIKKEGIIDGYDENNIEGIKYDFRMSSRILKARYGSPIDLSSLSESERVSLKIEPGEVVFVLTQEILNLPQNIKADLIPKRKLSHDGILTMGGFSIDPLYKGRLLVGLYNFSSSPFPLIPGKKLIAAEFKELDSTEIMDFPTPVPIYDFPDDLIKLMERYNPVSTQGLMNTVRDMDLRIDEIRKQFLDYDDWFKKFQESSGEQDKKIEKIITTIQKEVDDRRSEMGDFKDRTSQDIRTYAMSAYKTAAWVGTLGALIISGLIAIVSWYFQKGSH